MRTMLSKEQITRYERDGYLVVRNVIAAAQLEELRGELDGWIEESRQHSSNYGETPDGKARFDLEAGHTTDHPRLRRVANPVDISKPYQDALWRGPIVEAVADAIGPDVKFHHCKLNIKLPGMETRVDYHQDHPFDPHTNDDMLAALLMVDDMNEQNGCLRVVPGSHREEHYSHYRDGAFVSMAPAELHDEFQRRSVAVTGKAGDICLLHTWTLHGGPANRSDQPRRLLICDYAAADAFPLTPPMVPSPHSGRIVHGKPTRTARLVAGPLELPQRYQDDSFFGSQGQKAAGE
ncbi:MAG: phytanoyl-CoA dioxygenase family protein [Gammaproteobacteria bacterium]